MIKTQNTFWLPWFISILICLREFHKSRWINKRHKSRVTRITKIRYVYRKPINNLHDLAIWKWFKNVYISFDLKCICVWCLDNWSRILSGKPFNTFSRARLKTLQFRLTLTPLFTATHAFFFLSFTIFFHDLWLG
jgi:hypothetical protein